MKTQYTNKPKGLTASMYDLRESNSKHSTRAWAPFLLLLVAMIPVFVTLILIARHVAAA